MKKALKRVLILLPVVVCSILAMSILIIGWVFMGIDRVSVPNWLDAGIQGLMNWAEK